MIHVLLALLASTSPSCRYIDQWHGTNVPISPALPATDIVHAVSVMNGATPIGWIVGRRDGALWYFDGPVSGTPPAPADSRRALTALGLERLSHRDIGHGAMIPLPPGTSIARIVDANLQLFSCY
jgi:hypothetical protein